MKVTLDNFDGSGLRDYTDAVALDARCRLSRPLNRPAEYELTLVSSSPNFVVPANGARLVVTRNDTGGTLFTGYLNLAPEYEYLGWGERGPVYRYKLHALSDESLLDRKTLPVRLPFVARSAGEALRQLTEDVMPGVFDLSGIQGLDTIPSFASTPQKKWSEHAAEIALLSRGSYRAMDSTLVLQPVGATGYALNESDPTFSAAGLSLQKAATLSNDVTMVGLVQPTAYVTDYFIGDGLTLKFNLSERPFNRSARTLLNEEYVDAALRPARWTVTDPAAAVAVNGGKLQLTGGTGIDGQTKVQFTDKMEMGGARVFQHGDISFTAPSDGVLGGLYPGDVTVAGCLAGFRITKAGSQSVIQALINGGLAGSVLVTQSSHHYVLTTRLYSSEIYRAREVFHSSQHPAGQPMGGGAVAANLRVVLEVHDIDPGNPATLAAPATVLYDGVLTSVPQYCTYGLANSKDMHCAIAFTRFIQEVDAEVRSALPGQPFRTRLTGSLIAGAECHVTTEPALHFFGQYVPAPSEQIVVTYRAAGRALARVQDPASIASQQGLGDDGLRGAVHLVSDPSARTSVDCENAGAALLDDGTQTAWSGEYKVWSDFLPGGAVDVFPGDGLQINVPSQQANFAAVVRDVEIEFRDLAGDHAQYAIKFANEASQPLAFHFGTAHVSGQLEVIPIAKSAAGALYPAELTSAEVTAVTSTTMSIDAGTNPLPGGGFEVRRSDSGWGMANDQNLAGRFSTRNFTLPRLSRTQEYFLRPYDASAPEKYSRYSTLLHVDYPL